MTLPTEQSSEYAVGYRSWVWRDDGLYPLSMGRDAPWAPGVNEARCAVPTSYWSEPSVPHRPTSSVACKCGLHAHHRLSAMNQRETTLVAVRQPPNGFLITASSFSWDLTLEHFTLVYGAVLGWGSPDGALIYPRHWRAQKARILALIDESDAARQAAESYGVPVMSADTIESYALKFGMSYSPSDEELAEIDREQARIAQSPSLLLGFSIGGPGITNAMLSDEKKQT